MPRDAVKKKEKEKMTKTADVHSVPLDMALGQVASAFRASVSSSVRRNGDNDPRA